MSILSLPNLQIWKGWFSLLGRAEAAVFGSWGSRVGLPEGCSGGASVLLCLSACSWARCQATTKTPAGAQRQGAAKAFLRDLGPGHPPQPF